MTDKAALIQKSVLLIDGGLGTTLEDQHNVQFSSETPLWSSQLILKSPDTLLNVQEAFSAAGADIILTATYQASYEGFAKSGVSREAAKKGMQLAVLISRGAFQGRQGLVALSLGAYGATMTPSTEYSGEYGSMTENDLFTFHHDRLQAFYGSSAWAEIDLIAFETLPRLDEVAATRKVMKIVTDKPYWISCVFPNSELLPDGSDIESLVSVMLSGQHPPFAIGLNCTNMHKVFGLIFMFEEAATKLGLELPRLVIYPDGAGEQVYNTTTQKWVGLEEVNAPPWEEIMYQIVLDTQSRKRWKGILVGGCCKTTPQHIAKLRKLLDKQ